MRQAIDRYGGYVFRSSANGLTAAFETAGEAVNAALEAQRALRSMGVRMALLSGAAEVVNGEYVSQALPRLSRLLGAAHGGQVVLGRSTAARTDGSIALRELGAYRLPDLAQPEGVFQVVVPDCRRVSVRGARRWLAGRIGRRATGGPQRDVAALVDALRPAGCGC